MGQSITFDSKGSHNEGHSVNYQGSVSNFQYLSNGNTQYTAGSGGMLWHFVNNLENFKGDDHGFISINNDFESSSQIDIAERKKRKNEYDTKLKEEADMKSFGPSGF